MSTPIPRLKRQQMRRAAGSIFAARRRRVPESARRVCERQRNNLRRIAIHDIARPSGAQFLDRDAGRIEQRCELTQAPDTDAGETAQGAILRGPREDARAPQDDAAVC